MTEDDPHELVECSRCGSKVSRGLHKGGGCSVCGPEIPIDGAESKIPTNIPEWYQTLLGVIDGSISDADADEYYDMFIEQSGISADYYEKISKKSVAVGGLLGEVIEEMLTHKTKRQKSIVFVSLEQITGPGRISLPPDAKVLHFSDKGVFLERSIPGDIWERVSPTSKIEIPPYWYSLAWWDVDLEKVVEQSTEDSLAAQLKWSSLIEDESFKGMFLQIEGDLDSGLIDRDDELFEDYDKFLEWVENHPNIAIVADKTPIDPDEDEN